MSGPFVVDTNVVVAGLLTSEETAPTARLLDLMLRGRISFLLSFALLAEYRSVLVRERIARRHGLTAEEIDELLVALAENGIVLEAASDSALALPSGDDHLGGLLAAAPGALLVTGDEALRRAVGRRGLTPAAAWRLVGAGEAIR